MPVYNGARFIARAIESLRNQTFTDWELLISDNASVDETRAICERYCSIDPRIRYHRQPVNQGATANFKFLLDEAKTPYFMWAACDDLWHPDFIAACMGLLEQSPDAGFAFCSITNIDSYDRTIRTYPGFKRFDGESRLKNVIAYVSEPEIMGKANIVYAVFRTGTCKKAWETFPLIARWGSDMSLVLGALARSRLAIDDRVLFYKRITNEGDNIAEAPRAITIDRPDNYVFPVQESLAYLTDHLKATWGTKYFPVTLVVMSCRVCRETVKFTYHAPKKIWKKLFSSRPE